MKKYLGIIFCMALWGTTGEAFASWSGNDLTKEDIQASAHRVGQAFHSKVHANSIWIGEQALGEVSAEGDEFRITWRASKGEKELMKCMGTKVYLLEKSGLKIPGGGHEGLTKDFETQAIVEQIVKKFTAYKGQTQISSEQIKVIVEGSSAGAHRGMLTSAALKEHQDTKNQNIIVLMYASGNTFDDLAVKNLNSLLGTANILDFRAEEDEIAKVMNLPGVKESVGTKILFSANVSQDYKRRAQEKVYTNMDPLFKNIVSSPLSSSLMSTLSNFKVMGLSPALLAPGTWEAHQDPTYEEAAPGAWEQYKNSKKESKK